MTTMLVNIKSLIHLRTILLMPLVWLLLSGAAFSQTRHFPPGTHDVYVANLPGLRTQLLQNIAPVVEKSIAECYYPGAVILIGHKGKIAYRGVFGNRRIVPDVAPMRFNTIFDLASLTKIVTTTPAIMQLVEEGKVDLDVPVAHYWPAFGNHNKDTITVRELLTHTSGLPAELRNQSGMENENEIIQQISEMKSSHPPGQAFLYSDLNFIVLAHLVEIISGERIDNYAKKHIFTPLKMKDTFYLPSAKLRDRIAPTEIINHALRWGEVHDPVAHTMGGISGNAGLFSDAKDLGIYAESILNGGRLPAIYRSGKHRFTHYLGPLSVEKMTSPQTPENMADARGLGWDIDSTFSNRGVLLPVQSFGHSGYTGTSIWIDPVTKTWIIILTSRAHPTPAKHNQLVQDRRTIANIVSASIIDIKNFSFNNTGKGEIERAFSAEKK